MKTFTLLKKHIFLLLLCTIGILNANAYGVEVEGIYYNLNTNTKTAEVTNSFSSLGITSYYRGDIKIPESILVEGNKYTVTDIAAYAFFCCSDLTSITIPNSVTSIGGNAFSDCHALTSITIPNSVTKIGEHTFNGCTSLPIENNIRYADTYLVEVIDKSLTSYTIKEKTRFIGPSAFSDCKNLTSITLPNSIINIDDRAFENCYGLTSIDIPNSVTRIGSHTFNNCSGLTSVNIPYSVTSIGQYAFHYCYGLTSITIPNSVTSIERDAFSNCYNLTSVTLPNSITTISMELFYGCSNLTSITIPNSVTNIEPYAFYRCRSLTSINIPNSVTKISGHAFCDCSGLTSVKISNSVKNIEGYAFYACYSLTSVIIPSKTINIDSTLFRNCNNLTSIYCYNNIYQSLFSEYGDKVKLIDKIFYNPNCVNQTPTCLTIHFYPMNNSADTNVKEVSVIEKSIEYNGIKKVVNGELCIIEGLEPSKEYDISTYVKYSDNTIISENIQAKTKSVLSSFSDNCFVSPTSAKISATYTDCCTEITEKFFRIKDKTTGTITTLPFKEETIDDSSHFIITGLEPETTYSDLYLVVELNGGVTDTITIPSFTTPSLELTTEQPQGVSETTSNVSATTNLSNDETSVGFQWKKYDAPASLKPSEGYAAMNNGRIEGQIKRLQSTAYYNVRAFYKSAEGKYYYSDWVTFDPSDFSYIEPTIHTYPITNISQDAVSLLGYVLAGSDNIVEQGFEYWEATQSKALATIVQAEPYPTTDGDLNTVLSTGQVMNTPIEGLKPMTTYGYRAFVRTATKTIYGEELSFTTPEPVGIETTETNTPQTKTLKGYYDLHGHRYDTPQKGINILRFSDGTSRTILIK